MKKLAIILFLLANSASAAKLEDVRILGVAAKKDNVELKLQTRDGPKDSYFFVNIVKVDAESFEKLALVLRKITYGDKYKLNLNIPSFSVSPSGSSYQSEDVEFSGNLNGR